MILLSGIKVVEFTKGIAGSYAGMIFADLGAEVVKVEGIRRALPWISAVMREKS
jgi:crotonobetainyl-CoA:carnitine CoA-transferase CaiB-like acyl-CoA transferase